MIQQAVRFALFHVLQAGARTEQRASGAKGLTGPGYDGHAFWDTEGFVLPLLSLTVPDAAADALRCRASTLPLARERASTLGLAGAAFPWRTVSGKECSAYWPAGTVMCAEVGHLELAHRYAREAALFDLQDLHHHTGDGVHIASLADAWSALVAGVSVDHDELVLQAPDGTVQLLVDGEAVEVTPEAPQRRPLCKREPLLPPGREPPRVEEHVG